MSTEAKRGFVQNKCGCQCGQMESQRVGNRGTRVWAKRRACVYCEGDGGRVQRLTSSISVDEVREAPDVSEADDVAETGEDELEAASPVTSRLVLVLSGVVLRAGDGHQVGKVPSTHLAGVLGLLHPTETHFSHLLLKQSTCTPAHTLSPLCLSAHQAVKYLCYPVLCIHFAYYSYLLSNE